MSRASYEAEAALKSLGFGMHHLLTEQVRLQTTQQELRVRLEAAVRAGGRAAAGAAAAPVRLLPPRPPIEQRRPPPALAPPAARPPALAPPAARPAPPPACRTADASCQCTEQEAGGGDARTRELLSLIRQQDAVEVQRCKLECVLVDELDSLREACARLADERDAARADAREARQQREQARPKELPRPPPRTTAVHAVQALPRQQETRSAFVAFPRRARHESPSLCSSLASSPPPSPLEDDTVSEVANAPTRSAAFPPRRRARHESPPLPPSPLDDDDSVSEAPRPPSPARSAASSVSRLSSLAPEERAKFRRGAMSALEQLAALLPGASPTPV